VDFIRLGIERRLSIGNEVMTQAFWMRVAPATVPG
jgi:hypothetical protein